MGVPRHISGIGQQVNPGSVGLGGNDSVRGTSVTFEEGDDNRVRPWNKGAST